MEEKDEFGEMVSVWRREEEGRRTEARIRFRTQNENDEARLFPRRSEIVKQACSIEEKRENTRVKRRCEKEARLKGREIKSKSPCGRCR